MKTKTFKTVVALTTLLIFSYDFAFADWDARRRPDCRWWRAKYHTKANAFDNATGYKECNARDNDKNCHGVESHAVCSGAEAHSYAYDNRLEGWGSRIFSFSNYGFFEYQEKPTQHPLLIVDNDKKVSNNLSMGFDIYKKSNTVILKGITGFLDLLTGDVANDFSSLVITIYEYKDTTDSDPEIIWESKAIIKNGKLYFTGGFKKGDFVINTARIGNKHSLKAAIKNLEKRIVLPAGTNMENIEIGISGDAGNLNFGITEKFDVQNEENYIVLEENNSSNYPIKFESFPNPVTNLLNIDISLDESQHVTLALYDKEGNKVKDIYVGEIKKNKTVSITEDIATLSNGIYFLRLYTREKIWARTIIKK